MRTTVEHVHSQRNDRLDAPQESIVSQLFASIEAGSVDAIASDVGMAFSNLIVRSYELPQPPPKSDRNGTLGGPRPLVGQYLSTEWRLLHAKQDAPIANALDLLIELRGGRATMVKQAPASLLDTDAFIARDLVGVRAVCIAGCGLSWELQRRLQLRGLLVGRLPFTTEEAARSFAQRLREEQLNAGGQQDGHDQLNIIPPAGRVQLQRSAQDGFTGALERLLPHPMDTELRVNGFVATIGDSSDDACGVVLMTHGGVGPQLGEPIVDAAARTSIGRAAARGAPVFHLGCNGAGTSRDDPSISVAQGLGLSVSSTTTMGDAFSAFAERMLLAGSGAVVAHVGTTWSNAFEPATPLCDAVAWMVTGMGTAGHALSQLTNAANQCASDAFTAFDARDRVRAGLCWLQHLDLSQFVLLGDPSWSRRTGASTQ